MTRINRLLAVGFSLALVAACNEVPTSTPDNPDPSFKGGKPPSGTPVSVNITATSPGLSPDGGGAYIVTASPDGTVSVEPACGDRSLALQGMGGAFDALGTRTDCNGSGRVKSRVFLKFPDLMAAPTGPCPDLDAPDPTTNAFNFGVNSRYYFEADAGGYTLVLTDCYVTVTGNTRRVTATTGNLWQGQQGPGPVMTGVAINVDLTITQ